MNTKSTFRQKLRLAGIAAVVGVTGLGNTAQARAKCFANWSQAAPVVRSEGLVAAKNISRLVRKALSAKVVRITLCKTSNGYKYRLVVVGKGGKVRNLTLDARNPVVR